MKNNKNKTALLKHEIRSIQQSTREIKKDAAKCLKCGLWKAYPYSGGRHSWRKCQCEKKNKEIREFIYEKISKLTKEKFDDESYFASIGIDQLDLIELITNAEYKFGVDIQDEELFSSPTILKAKQVKHIIEMFDEENDGSIR